MSETKTWKHAVLPRGVFTRPVDIPVRTDGTAFQVWTSRSIMEPINSTLEDWFQSVRDETEDLEDRKIDLDVPLPMDDFTPVEVNIFVSGWRSWLTDAEKAEIATLTFA